MSSPRSNSGSLPGDSVHSHNDDDSSATILLIHESTPIIEHVEIDPFNMTTQDRLDLRSLLFGDDHHKQLMHYDPLSEYSIYHPSKIITLSCELIRLADGTVLVIGARNNDEAWMQACGYLGVGSVNEIRYAVMPVGDDDCALVDYAHCRLLTTDEIDPEKMTEAHARFLGTLLPSYIKQINQKPQQDAEVYKTNEVFIEKRGTLLDLTDMHGQRLLVLFSLKKSLLSFRANSGQSKFLVLEDVSENDEVLSKRTTPLTSLTTLYVARDGCLRVNDYRQPKKRVALKIQWMKDDASMQTEFNILRLVKYLKAKPFAIIDAANGVHFLIEKHINGNTTYDYFPGYQDSIDLEPIQRLKLIREILYALADIHKLAILHRDISENNVLVELVDDDVRVTIIDFESARRLSDSDTPYRASWGYRPAEFFTHAPTTPESDLHSAALVIGMLLGSEPIDPESEQTILENNDFDVVFDKLFSRLDAKRFLGKNDYFAERVKSELIKLLRAITVYNQSLPVAERRKGFATHADAIQRVEKAINLCAQQLHAGKVNLLEQVYDSVMTLRANLAASGSTFEKTCEYIAASLRNLSDDSVAVRHFVDLIRIKEFSKFKNKIDVQLHLSNLLRQYKTVAKELYGLKHKSDVVLAYLNKIASNEADTFRMIVTMIQRAIALQHEYTPSVDNMVELSQRMEYRVKKIHAKMGECKFDMNALFAAAERYNQSNYSPKLLAQQGGVSKRVDVNAVVVASLAVGNCP